MRSQRPRVKTIVFGGDNQLLLIDELVYTRRAVFPRIIRRAVNREFMIVESTLLRLLRHYFEAAPIVTIQLTAR